MKKLKLLKLIREIKSINKNDFHVFRVDADTDYSTMGYLSELLNKKNIKHVIVRNDFDIKSLRTASKKDLLDDIKKEIGLEEPEIIDNLKVYQDCTIDVELSTKTDTKLQYNDLVIKYSEKDNQVVIYYDCKESKLEYIFKVQKKDQKVYFTIKNNFPFGLTFENIKNLQGEII